MLQRLCLIVFSLLFSGLSPFQAQELIVEGTVMDRSTREFLSRVSVVVDETNWGASTRNDGFYRIKLKTPGDYKLYFSYVGYAEEMRTISKSDFPNEGSKTITRSVALIFKSTELPEVTISAESRPDTVHGTQAYNIADFAFLGTDDMALLTYEKSIKRNASIMRLNSEIPRFTKLPENPTELFTDFKQRIYAIYDHTVYALEPVGNFFDTLQLDKEEFTNRIRPIEDSLDHKLLYSDYKWFYPRFNYFLFDRHSEKSEALTTVENEELMELYRSEYKYLSPRKRLEATQMEYETGIDREEYAALMSDFPNSMYFEPLYAPALLVFDTIMVFDHYSNTLKKFNKYSDLIGEVPIYYHTLTEDGSKWEQQLIQDIHTQEIYGLFKSKGSYYLRQIDTGDGRLLSNFKLTHRYVEQIKIRDGWVYYLYRPFGSIQNIYLYKEEIR